MADPSMTETKQPTESIADAHKPTLEVIRKITDDGILTEQEVFDLADYLNKNEEARNNWPGDSLFEILHQVFEDGILSEDEMARLAKILTDIETLCANQFRPPSVERNKIAQSEIKLDELLLPRVQKTIEISVKDSDDSFKVNLAQHTCSCPGWFGNRKDFKPGSLKRCCLHMAEAFWQQVQVGAPEEWPRLFKDFVEELSYRGRGVDPGATWKLLKIEEKPYLVSYGDNEWSNVYAPIEGGKFDRYGYSRKEQRWAFGQIPEHYQVIEEFLDSIPA